MPQGSPHDTLSPEEVSYQMHEKKYVSTICK